MAEARRLRLGLIGTGWITARHLPVLAGLGRTELVGVVARDQARAAAVAASWGGAGYDDLGRMLDEQSPDVAFVCLPPDRSPAACAELIRRGIPFLTEKPLGAVAGDPERIAASLAGSRLVTAVGYQWRGFDFLPELRARLASHPAHLLLARWTGPTPGPSWWRHVAESGGQVVEQATHLYDLARLLLGEGQVLAAASSRHPRPAFPDADVDDVATAVVRFSSGALASFTSSCLLPSAAVEFDLVSEGWRSTIRLADTPDGPSWTLTLEDESGLTVRTPGRDPYEVQAEAFLDAVRDGDPGRVLSSYGDALLTDRLTRAVVTATGSTG
ncbi:MAG TPA: Gfo/Idh/MocA family oxidoreductase [Candidatus Limnocylindrales bacterium]